MMCATDTTRWYLLHNDSICDNYIQCVPTFVMATKLHHQRIFLLLSSQ